MRSLHLLLCLSLAAGLAGCVSGPKFYAIAQPQPTAEKSIAYIYFVGDGTYRGRPSFSVDRKPIAAVGQWEYSWCHLSPGEHTFRAEWSLMEKPMFEGGQFEPKELHLTIEPSTIYYICYSVRENGEPPTILEKSGGLIGKAFSKSHVTSVELVSEEKVGAIGLLSGCAYRPSELEK